MVSLGTDILNSLTRTKVESSKQYIGIGGWGWESALKYTQDKIDEWSGIRCRNQNEFGIATKKSFAVKVIWEMKNLN